MRSRDEKMRNREITVFHGRKQSQQNYIFIVMAPGHNSVRLKEIPGKGWWCPLGWGPTIPKTRTVLVE